MTSAEDLFAAIRSGDAGAVATALAADPALASARTATGESAVLLAVYHGEPTIAETLVGAGAQLDIFEAAALGDRARVEAALTADPSLVNGIAADGFTPLGLAAFFGHTQVVDLLLASGGRVNEASHNGQRVMPLHSAVAGQHYQIARALVDAGADVNARQADDFAPLHGAAQNGQVQMLRLLLDHGADPTARTANDQTPLDIARAAGQEEAAAYLVRHATKR